jgi:hypothetical protein
MTGSTSTTERQRELEALRAEAEQLIERINRLADRLRAGRADD